MKMKYDDSYVRNNVSELKSLNTGRMSKYERNYNYYNNTPSDGLHNIRNTPVVGWYNRNDLSEIDTSETPSINVIKSTSDTLSSKISQSKVRPFFNAIDGSFKDIQVCRQSQQFFDQYFEIEEVNKKVSLAFRDACIFEMGCVYVDPINKCITRALPWQIFARPSELTYNNITRIYYEQGEYPVTLLPDEVAKLVEGTNQEYVTYGVYYDTKAHIMAQYVTGCEKMIITPYDGNRVPFIFLWYTNPIMGGTSLSIVDQLYTIQKEINIVMGKIKDASQLSPALTFFVPDSGNLKTQQINNRTGNIIPYRVTPDMPSNPVTVATPAFIDSQYIALIDNLVAKAYELVGVSMLSAQSKKPTGVGSGIALQTLQDVESERFQTQLDQVIRCYVDIAKTCLRVFPKDEDILPESIARVSIKWKDVVEEEKKMSIQFSAADSLSKDPSTKLQQLQQLAQAGIIPQSRIAQFMQLPDLEGGYSLSNNAVNAVLTVIDECIENKDFDYTNGIPEYIPIQMLKEEIVNTQLSLRAANYKKNKEDIDKLTKLYKVCDKLDAEMMQQANQDAMAMQQEAIAQQAQLQQQAQGQGQLPAGPNVLDQIVQQQDTAQVPQVNPGDLDVSSENGQGVTGWDNRPYSLKG